MLSSKIDLKIKFNEVDALGVVWHGHYIRFFEDGREAFGDLHGLAYLDIITPQANLRETLQLDSLDYIDLVVVIESNFGFKPKGEDFIPIQTFQDFYNYVIAKMAAR